MVILDDSLEKWDYKEHIKVKHEILSKYLYGWINILGKFFNLNIFDCFSGRGKYTDGSEGSPLIILKKLTEIRKKVHHPDKAACIFIEKNENNFRNLQEKIDQEIGKNKEVYTDWLEIEMHNNEFSDVAKDIISNYGKSLAPSFFFIDPFGFSGVPFEVIKEILSINRTEILITFMVRDVNRFLTSSPHRISIEDLFGIKNVKEALRSQYSDFSQEKALLKLYRDRLHEDAGIQYSFPFKVNADDRLQTTYYLIHCTNHPKGCELMKEIMYKSGTEGRFGYFGPAEGQMTLEQAGGVNRLKKFLVKKFKSECLSYQEVRYQTLMETDFLKKHYREALLELESEGKVSIENKGPRGGLPDNAQITFK